MMEALSELKIRAETLESELKDKKKELATMEEAILVHFDAEGMTSVKVAGLGNFIAQGQTYFSIKSDKKEGVLEAFKKYAPSLVKETINANSLSAFMREAEKEGQEVPAEIKEGVSSYDKRWISWRRG